MVPKLWAATAEQARAVEGIADLVAAELEHSRALLGTRAELAVVV